MQETFLTDCLCQRSSPEIIRLAASAFAVTEYL